MLVGKFGLRPSQYQIGRTKIFFRPGVLGFVEDKWAAMHRGTLLIQVPDKICVLYLLILIPRTDKYFIVWLHESPLSMLKCHTMVSL